MPRQLRIQYEGAIYHLLSRGDRREHIFWDETDRHNFLELLERTCGRTGWQVHAYCLMSNHFHLVVETPRPNLVEGMKWLLGTYSMRFNRRHRLTGHLFGNRYKSLLIDESDPFYLRAVCDYVHLNPVRAGLIEADEPLESYKWTSYGSYLRRVRRRPAWLRCDRLLGEHGLADDTTRGRKEFGHRMEVARLQPNETPEKQIRRAWLYGAEDFVVRLIDRFEESQHKNQRWERDMQSEEEVAERIVRAGMKELGWREEDLCARRKGDLGKIRLAKELRARTAMNLQWIARRLEMGSWSYVSNLLREAETKKCK
jgi:putative transposase